MKRRIRQLLLPMAVPRAAVTATPAPSLEARRIALALRDTAQPIIDFHDGTKPPPAVVYHLKPRERFRPRQPKETRP